jgi:hypothetical protein
MPHLTGRRFSLPSYRICGCRIKIALAYINCHTQWLEDYFARNSALLKRATLLDHDVMAMWIWDMQMKPPFLIDFLEFVELWREDAWDAGEDSDVLDLTVESSIRSILTCLLVRWQYTYEFGEPNIEESLRAFKQLQEMHG